MKPQLTLIAAMDEERLIATANDIPWHLPRDVAHFREYTKNQWLLLGRRTYGQMLGWFREGHMPLVLTHRTGWKPERGSTVASIEEALRMTGEAGRQELVCCGGGQVYEKALPLADRLVLTRIRHRFPTEEGAVYFPQWKDEEWRTEEEKDYPSDAENAFPMSISVLTRVN